MRIRLVSLLSAAALLVLAAPPVSASSEGHSYLALGDSIAFGFNPNPALWPDISNFVGYPEIVAQRLNIEDVNASCPGEATGGFISLTGTDNGCRDYRSAFPLHVTYSGTQLAFATSYLATHKRTRLVTLMLGANDLGRWLTDCGQTPPGPTCALGFDGMLAIMQSNLNLIFSALRATGYTGLIIALTYPALKYKDPFSVGLALALNGPMQVAAAANGVLIASGFDAFAAASASAGGDICAAGLQLPAFPPGTAGCDIHPSALGRDVLAATIVKAVADSCPAHDPIGCLNQNRD